MKKLFLSCLLFLFFGWVSAQSPQRQSPEPSRCHVFIDDQNIWTLEVIEDRGGAIIPIINIITFSPGEWDFRPREIRLYSGDQEARAEKFSMDTGVPDEPYLMEYLRVLGNSFIGLDLLGKFDNFAEPTQVVIDLGEDRFQLEPLECMDFEALAGKIDQINFNSPNLWEDFEVLQIEFMGQKMPVPPE
jgi:hypothetical protein